MKRAEILKILSEELNPWTKDILPFGRVATRIKAAIDKTKVEPLAVLADRKGWSVCKIIHADTFWVVKICSWGKVFDSQGDTYAAAESKAYRYLTSLPDKK